MTRKLLFGFALLVCAALVGVVVNDNPMTYADDSEKASPNTTNETPPATTNEAKPAENAPKAQPEPMPSALPANESPLWPENPIFVQYYEERNLEPYTSIAVIIDGKRVNKDIDGDPDQTVHFAVRTDGWEHASVQFFGNADSLLTDYKSAIVLVPNEEAKNLWETWLAKKCAEGRKLRSRRAYPSNVLPPK